VIRLFCFPYPGAGAAAFRDWQARLPSAIEVCPVELPGRGSRLVEDPFDLLPGLCPALAADLLPRCDRPFSFFGHGAGALVAFELARQLRRDHGLLPDCLFVSARRAPRLENYDYRPEPPLACPILAFGGIEDREITADQLEPWRDETAAEFRLFLHSAKPHLFGILTHELRVLTETGVLSK
jgi:medium-chain acyl-[acyl-carrier-protein] hydrolase